MDYKQCPNCGNIVIKESMTCDKCGFGFVNVASETKDNKIMEVDKKDDNIVNQLPEYSANDNLIICKTCGEKMAKSEKKCPKCGAKNKETINKKLLTVVVILLAVIGIIILLLSLTKNKIVGNYEITDIYIGDVTVDNATAVDGFAKIRRNGDVVITLSKNNGDVTIMTGNWGKSTRQLESFKDVYNMEIDMSAVFDDLIVNGSAAFMEDGETLFFVAVDNLGNPQISLVMKRK